MKPRGLHHRNKHRNGYDFAELARSAPALKPHLRRKKDHEFSIDFADPLAVKELNCAILHHHYMVNDWDIPNGFLCPPVPGRVDYIHYMAELIAELSPADSPTNDPIKMLDIGTGANGIYSILARAEYGWECVGSDIDPASLDNLRSILSKNPQLESGIELRLQKDKSNIFANIIQEGEYYTLSVCNPPFHASPEEATKANLKKLKNLGYSDANPCLNFGGQKAELWCAGGEFRFLKRMIKESKCFAKQCGYFTSLVSKRENLEPSIKLLKKLGASFMRKIEMKQGNKTTRILAWSFI